MRLAFILSLALAAGGTLMLATPAAAQERVRTFNATLQPCPGGHRVRLRANRRYMISAESEAFDTVVRLYRPGSDAVLAQDDDSGDDNNSRLTYTARATGDHIVCVAAYSTGGTGAYSVRVEPLGAAPPLPPPVSEPTRTETALRRIFEGSLAEGDQQDDGRWFDDYQLSLRPGQRAQIGLDSSAFDTLLKIYPAADRGGTPTASDDDGGGELNSFLRFTPEQGGDFIVRVTTFGPNAGGAYQLRIED